MLDRLALSSAEFQSASDGLSLLTLWNIVKRRRFLILATTLLLLAAAIAASVLSAREYEATGEIQVQKDSSDALGLDSLMGAAAGGAGDALEANVTLQTQAKILESQTLGLEVVNKLSLADTKDFKPKFSVMGWISGLVSPAGVADAPTAVLNDSPNKRDRVFNIFKANTKVAPVTGTRLIQVSYTSQDPKLAAAVVNGLIDSLIDYNFQTRYAAPSPASDGLGKQL